MELQSLLQRFISFARESEQITVYNHAGLLHDLATFLQQNLVEDRYDVQLERRVEHVVMDAKNEGFAKEAIDLYIYQTIGKEQCAIQVIVHDEQGRNEAVSEIENNLLFLRSLKKHGFKEAYLLLTHKAHTDEADLELPQCFLMEWQELQPTSQDRNGPWLSTVFSV